MLINKISLFLFLFIIGLPPDHSTDKEKANYHFYKGKSARQDGNYSKAINNYLKAIKSEPANTQYVMALIQAYFENGEFQKAEKSLKLHKSSFSNEDDAFIWNFIFGLSLACNGEHHKAYVKFLEAEKLICNLDNQDSTIISHLYNNLGCEKILNQPKEWSPHLEDHPHLSINFNVFAKAWPYFATALRYNPQNEIVLQNMEYISTFCDCFEEMKNAYTDHTIRINNIEKKKEKSVTIKNFRPPTFGIKFLPDKIWQIINILNEYDEIVLLLDISESMDTEIAINDKEATRFEVMVDLAKYLASSLDYEVQIGGISIGSECDESPVLKYKPGEVSREKLIAEINALELDGYTPLNDIMSYTNNLFSDTTEKKAVLLCTDGINSCGEGNTCEIAKTLYDQGINIYILSFLVEQDSQEEYSVFDCIANMTEGEIYEIQGQQGIVNKTLGFEPPFYSLLIPSESIDTSYCLRQIRLKCDIPCIPKIF